MKKEDIKAYKNTKRGYKIYPKLNRIFIDGILCILCSIFLVVSTIITRDKSIFYYFAVAMFGIGIYFIILSNKFKSEEIYKMKKEILDKEKKETKDKVKEKKKTTRKVDKK